MTSIKNGSINTTTNSVKIYTNSSNEISSRKTDKKGTEGYITP